MTWHITSIPIEDQYKACRTATDALNELSDRIGLVAAIFVVIICTITVAYLLGEFD